MLSHAVSDISEISSAQAAESNIRKEILLKFHAYAVFPYKQRICYSFNLILSIPKILRENIYIKLFSIYVRPDNFNGILITFIFSKVSLFQKAISEQG